MELVTERLVLRVPGRGTFVTPKQAGNRRILGSLEVLVNLTPDTELEVVPPLTETFEAEAAERLKVTRSSPNARSFLPSLRGPVFWSTRWWRPPQSRPRSWFARVAPAATHRAGPHRRRRRPPWNSRSPTSPSTTATTSGSAAATTSPMVLLGRRPTYLTSLVQATRPERSSHTLARHTGPACAPE